MAVSVCKCVYVGVSLGKVSLWLGVTDLYLDVHVSLMAGCPAWSWNGPDIVLGFI